MKMPKTCDDCQVSCDCPHDEHIDGYMMEKPSRFCPLKELPTNHGDLIDRDALLEDGLIDKMRMIYTNSILNAPIIIPKEISE
jgi:hypothetical protein